MIYSVYHRLHKAITQQYEEACDEVVFPLSDYAALVGALSTLIGSSTMYIDSETGEELDPEDMCPKPPKRKPTPVVQLKPVPKTEE